MKAQRWFGFVVLFTLLTMLIVYVISVDSPVVIFRYVFGFVFVTVLPGYCLVNVLFSKGNKLALVEAIVLSVALSFGLAGIVGLFLGLSPIGINFTSITVSLSATVLFLSAVAFMRRRRYERSTCEA